MAAILDLVPTVAKAMPFLASTLNRSSRVLSTSRPNLIAVEKFAPNSPFIALTALTICIYAVMSSAYIRNRCYNARAGKIAYELMTSQKPNLSNLHVFGGVCYAYLQNKSKLDTRCEKIIVAGYDRHSPAYLVYFAESNRVEQKVIQS